MVTLNKKNTKCLWFPLLKEDWVLDVVWGFIGCVVFGFVFMLWSFLCLFVFVLVGGVSLFVLVFLFLRKIIYIYIYVISWRKKFISGLWSKWCYMAFQTVMFVGRRKLLWIGNDSGLGELSLYVGSFPLGHTSALKVSSQGGSTSVCASCKRISVV